MGIIILLFVLATEVNLKPRIDITREGKYLLWYGVKHRKYIVIW